MNKLLSKSVSQKEISIFTTNLNTVHGCMLTTCTISSEAVVVVFSSSSIYIVYVADFFLLFLHC